MTRACSLFATLLTVQCPKLGGCPTALAECMSQDCSDYKQTHKSHSGHRPTITDGDTTHSSPTWPAVPSPLLYPTAPPPTPAFLCAEAHGSGRPIHWDKELEETQDAALSARGALCWAGLAQPLPPFPIAAKPLPPREGPHQGERLDLGALPCPHSLPR